MSCMTASASFDRLRMRNIVRGPICGATKKSPHPELVEGRAMVLQPGARLTP